MKARLLSILTACYVLAALAARPSGRVPFLKSDTDSLRGDSIPLRAYTILPDTLEQDTVPVDTTPKSKNALDMPVNYSAEDSITFDYANSRAHLYGASKVKYQNLELEADIINISIDSSLVHAISRTDSLGNVTGKPIFRQGTDEYEPDSISYNFKSRKAYISNVYTQQGEGYMKSLDAKRDSSGTMYVKKAFYSTCDAEHPHFYLNMTRAKVRPGKDVVFGPTYLVVCDVPLPLAIPYGFFPFKSKYSSGFIMPSYGDETTRGFYLREGGYYFAFNDFVDAKILGDIYTKGSWALSAQSTYKKRYRYSGNLYLRDTRFFQTTACFDGHSAVVCADFGLLEQQRYLVDFRIVACSVGHLVEGCVVASDDFVLACLLANLVVTNAEAHHIHAHICRRLVGTSAVDAFEEGVEDREYLHISVVVDGDFVVGIHVEGVDHVDITEK